MDEFGINPQSFQAGPEKRRGPFFTQRTLLIGLGSFVFLGIFFGFTRLISDIREPFLQTQNTNSDRLAELNSDLVALSSKDTDGDSINDFQELYQTGTSPYLADSDSDGVTDSAELAANTNPNCPEGENCTGFLPVNTNTAVTQNTNGATSDDDNITAEAIRETLKNSGAPEYLLDATSDEELLSIYQQVAGVEPSTNTNDAASPTTFETLENFTPDDIRELLASTGADASLLEQVSDEDLKDIFSQALEEQQNLFTTNTNNTP